MTTRRKTKHQEQNALQKIKTVEAKTQNQENYIRAIVENDVVFCSGPSGCGKSYIAAGIASDHLYRGIVDQIIITRPIVCTGKDIGSLPGDVLEKIGPYLIPMQENFRFFLGQTFYGLFVAERKIRYEPLEMMRGSTFNNSYLILDEAQNCTYDQIKMFITRIGKNSKVLINGDIRQTDLKTRSGLMTCIEQLKNVEGVGITELNNSDIQRNGIIGRILNAMENNNA